MRLLVFISVLFLVQVAIAVSAADFCSSDGCPCQTGDAKHNEECDTYGATDDLSSRLSQLLSDLKGGAKNGQQALDTAKKSIWKNYNVYPIGSPIELEYVNLCDALDNYPASELSATELLNHQQKWLHRAMNGLQHNNGLDMDTPVADATEKCKSLGTSDPICVWLRAHEFMSTVFTPDWNNLVVESFDPANALFYLLFTSSHPAMVDICSSFFSFEMDYQRFIGDIVVFPILKHFLGQGDFDQVINMGGVLNDDLPTKVKSVWKQLCVFLEGWFKKEYTEKIEAEYQAKCNWDISVDIYKLDAGVVDYCSVLSYLVADGFPMLTMQPYSVVIHNYTDVLAGKFADYESNRNAISKFVRSLGPKSELAIQFEGMKSQDEHSDYYLILSTLIPLSTEVLNITLSSGISPETLENRKAAVELFISIWSPKSDKDRILTDNVQLAANMFREGRTEQLKDYAEYLPKQDQIQNCTSESICPMIQKYLDVIHDYYIEATSPRVAIIHTNVNYPVYLGQKSMEEILHISQDGAMSLPEIAQHLKKEFDKAINDRFDELKEYFQVNAKFNLEKAVADIGYIKTSLENFNKSSDALSTEVDDGVSTLVEAVLQCLYLESMEDTAKLGLSIAEACNPFKAVFNGGTATEIMDRSAAAARAIVQVIKIQALADALKTLRAKLTDVAHGFDTNNKFLIFLKNLVDSVNTTTSRDEFETQKDIFFKHYNGYTPNVTKPQLAELSSFYEAVVELSCDALDDMDSTSGQICKGPVAANGLCWKLKIKIDKMMETYSEIYDYQFDFIDSVASYMQALTAYFAAGQIGNDWEQIAHADKDEPDLLTRLEIMAGISYITYQHKTWQTIEEYCDFLEYKEGGMRPDVCEGPNTDIADLAAYIPAECNPIEGFFDIPIRFTNGDYKDVPPRDSDGFLDFSDLFQGNEVSFTVPDAKWLVDHQWIPDDDNTKNNAIYVTKFEVYLPIETETSTNVQVIAKPTAENPISPGGKGYTIVPIREDVYEYLEGKENTPCHQMPLLPNPYTICSTNKPPDICVLTDDGQDTEITTKIYPSIYTLWQLKVSGYENIAPPKTAIPLNIKVGLTLCTWDPNNVQTPRLTAVDRCCTNNDYWSPTDVACVNCPADSTSALHGYYCEKSSKPLPK